MTSDFGLVMMLTAPSAGVPRRRYGHAISFGGAGAVIAPQLYTHTVICLSNARHESPCLLPACRRSGRCSTPPQALSRAAFGCVFRNSWDPIRD
ncbi:hypothetical protein ACCAA_510053 [Candidatus Accumulibacter aalborgensis]|uniref:Uncharacterized protein n=1 Tax=Candidatus Accumulibacter aalborgensis TaxID=1860102 RepID=A0A1A8XSE2_9PROT|nr:hypothetical protein ACCAA_510053 [Candidatus Accumulibacter aalborgensis]